MCLIQVSLNRLQEICKRLETRTELILTKIAGQDIETTETGDNNADVRQQYLYVGENALNVYKFFNDEENTYKKTVDGVEIDTKYSNTEFNDSLTILEFQ